MAPVNISRTILLMALLSFTIASVNVNARGKGNNATDATLGRHIVSYNVTYDGKSLIINGRREILFSGSIHYTRSTPDMWPDLLDKAKRGGLNVIQTYVFWNAHEPEQGKFNFEGNYDLVKFIRLIHSKGMFVTLRIGPFIQAEWNHGGLPYWLREVPDIKFRTDNEPYKKHMQAFVTKIIQMMKDANLFVPQGGPIILAQIENEYNHVQLAYREKGDSYVKWAADMAVSTHIGVPWIMCKQKDAPDPVINACNGRYCGDTFEGPNKPYKPVIWTENWTVQKRVIGDPPTHRSAEDIAFAVARFFSKNGNLVNYYMYHGGTNFGRTTAIFSATRYYDDAPLDEYGLERMPKWSHLRDLHKALLLCRKVILGGDSTFQKLNEFHEIRTFENPDTKACAAFISNSHTDDAATINFRGNNYILPPRSVTMLPDCKTEVFNTHKILSQHNYRSFERSTIANNFQWEMYNEEIPTTKKLPINQYLPAELYNLLKDKTDYAWYTKSFELSEVHLPKKPGVLPVLKIDSLGHTMVVFINGDLIGTGHGSHVKHPFTFEGAVKLRAGTNYISILSGLVGLPDSGSNMERRYAGPKTIRIHGLNTGDMDLTRKDWSHGIGLKGEDMKLFAEEGSLKAVWSPVNPKPQALTWYKTRFATPEGTGPVAIRMNDMGKGMVWVNGNSIGRYWMSYLTKEGNASQAEYHIPRAFLNPQDNLLVIFEEERATPEKVEILNINRDIICSFVSENYPANVNSWVSRRGSFHPVTENLNPQASLQCPAGKHITAVQFASFGNPTGTCGDFYLGNCNAPAAKQIVEKECLGKEECTVALNREVFNQSGVDACANLVKTLVIQVRCS